MEDTQENTAGRLSGWRANNQGLPSLPEAHRSLRIPPNAKWFRKFLAFAGPGYMVAVGYMDPGNWATDIEGGSRFGYTLLSVILISNLMAILLQSLAGKLGIVTGKDLAQACRDNYSKPVVIGLWILCELAIAACDLAEVIGTAIALNLLFGLPLLYGVIITAVDVLLILILQNKGFRFLEMLIIVLIATIAVCFGIDLFLTGPDMGSVLMGYVPTAEVISNPQILYVAIAILGATVMPHNLYLHSSIVQTRQFDQTAIGKRQAIKYMTWDSTIALTFALFINSAILIVSAAAFHSSGLTDVTDIGDAYHLLTPIVGTTLGSIMFAVALLASGQNSTLTGTLAGQIVMEGFINLRLKPWLRRLITRLIAIIPAVIVTAIYGDSGVQDLLIFSQVILSLQLPFAVVPLVKFTGSRTKMGEFANKARINILAWLVTGIIIALNIFLLYQTITS
ncbi:Nramp family divalent metal transporter [Paenibacillus sp. YPG26]|uniref:Nramp family divalent metal transporter n=1 Tax=Paenibacillus sp. YPG26 TaxID=2878915 RepID=UPI00203F9790|nr:Nramp family divalent metal transporter [Paenibacillus sp. YPG26]USB34102.1 Nramp family divalent metal transporter [Paenibacillus sp. YPG26]